MENSIENILEDVAVPSIELNIPVSSSKDLFSEHKRKNQQSLFFVDLKQNFPVFLLLLFHH